ncbi:MAG: peptidyl-prolyl cis-trans isomerase [Acidobacteriota bacterium]|nr:peptidyl-prolyl cis-trans isomerase [Acidobacteriota bacterium]
MIERQTGDERARRERATAKVKLSLRLFTCLALLVLLVGSLTQRHVRSSAPPRDARDVLLNPRHKFWDRQAPDIFRVKFETSKGNFVVEARREWSPRGVDRFYNLVRAGFFDDSRFFRVRAGFIAQFGIAGDPTIAAVWQDQTIRDDAARQSNTRGFVTYAMTGADARTTQLFVNLGDNSRLDREGFAPIGKVIEGMEVVDQLYAGYGEDAGGGMRGGKQGKIFAGGNAYLDREFPKLDRLLRASVLKKK